MSRYVEHFLMEMIGQGVLAVAYQHVCRRPWHRAAIYAVGTILTTVLTVQVVG